MKFTDMSGLLGLKVVFLDSSMKVQITEVVFLNFSGKEGGEKVGNVGEKVGGSEKRGEKGDG